MAARPPVHVAPLDELLHTLEERRLAALRDSTARELALANQTP